MEIAAATSTMAKTASWMPAAARSPSSAPSSAPRIAGGPKASAARQFTRASLACSSAPTPLVIMAPIPLTLAGILPAHALTGAFFTATSMIGMIALAGIIVRNSILLVDFIELARERGAPLTDAVVEAGVVRARPILLTAAAVVIGGAVMVADPIFQGLGIALMSGAVVATLLTLVVIPLLYAEAA